MEENTLTFTARGIQDPDKMATFTLQNGSVSVQLGNTLLKEMVNVSETYQAEEDVNMADLTKATAVGAAQKMLRTLPLQDFDANIDGNTLHTTAWIRKGGLRAAPVSMTWQEVDNPDAARAFVQEVEDRKEQLPKVQALPSILDYWVSWLVLGVSGVVAFVIMLQLVKHTLYLFTVFTTTFKQLLVKTTDIFLHKLTVI